MANPAGGPPEAFKSPAIFKKRIKEFFDYCKAEKRIPFIVGFAVHSGVPLPTIEGYKHREGYEALYQSIKDASHNELLHRGLNGEANAGFAKFVMINHQGYTSDKQEIKQEISINAETETLKAIQKKISKSL